MQPKDWANVSLRVGPFYVYSLTMMLGMLASILTVLYFWRREKYSFEQLSIMVFIALPTAIIGARFVFVIQQLIEHKGWVNGPWYKMFFIWEGGLSIHGGVITSTICCILYIVFSKNQKKIDLKKAFSIILPAVLIGQAIGRWGNFANHEVYGQIMSESSLAFRILTPTIRQHMFIGGHYRLPLFLYESIANLVGYLILVWILNYYNWLRPGTTGALYIVYYGIVRFGMEPLRQESYNIYKVISALYIVVGLVLLVMFEFVIKLKYNVYKVYRFQKEWTHKLFYFIVYEPKDNRKLLVSKKLNRLAETNVDQLNANVSA
ncbi:prolipoprotein diacylglyceryl transferase [Mycoplasma enhydrae]|uniref:prolipoprotein diacylglyceryl transferase n=1 Tax=Mycoplasma enhydrae TaxID=2499220 RepID=UPI00197C9DFF|nr:prolipoprotein diacylglyceryl transferase [Mycoplasma enhydrae]MBN4089732.1 prolipoprotein diacylglyceryl transferase [Mycoplasma enhydrae]MCV3753730.1 prolipoprotein diacylglyceryl transferase [Mycoplasma enhydrae]